jgi:hypothetical protein
MSSPVIVGQQPLYGVPLSTPAVYAFYPGDVPPASPSPINDEFDGTLLKGKWTVLNGPTVTVSGGSASLTHSIDGQNHAIGQPMPSGVWEVTAKIRLVMPSEVNYCTAGIIITNSSGGSLQDFALVYNGGEKWVVAGYNSLGQAGANAFQAGPAGFAWGGPDSRTWVWLRVHDNTTNFLFSVSFDGTHFWQVASVGRTSYVSTPNQVGLTIAPESSGAGTLYCDYFRRTA